MRILRQRHTPGRMALGSILVAFIFLIGFGPSGGAVVAGAAAATPATPTTVAVNPYIESKSMLPQTSIDGPALWTSPSGTIRGAIVYTGTDATHHLNVMTSTDGIHYGDRQILNETSFVRPALVRFGSSATDNIALAWTGTDTNRSLNVLVGRPGFGFTKMTLWHDNSFTAPSLALNGAELYLAWAGTDANHSLNVAHIVWRGGMSIDHSVTLWNLHAASRPSLTYDPNSSQLLLSWTALGTNRIALATSTDGAYFTVASASPLAEWSYSGPSMVGFPVNNMPRHFLAWTGTDTYRCLNVQFTESFPKWGDTGATKSTFWSEWAMGGPALGYVGTYNRVLLAWTGTDTAHHLNVAVVSVGQ